MLFATPSVHLFSPDIHTRSQKPLVLFKGKVENTESLTINGHPVEIYNNRFYIKAILHPHQTNIFTLKAANNHQETTILTRKVDYFPENIQETTTDYIKPNPPKDDMLHNKWHITGRVQDVKSLYIQGKEIPIQENNLFEFNIQKEQNLSELTLTTLTNHLVLYTEKVGLSETPYHISTSTEKAPHSSTSPSSQDIESIIHQHYYKQGWMPQDLNKTQKTMIKHMLPKTSLEDIDKYSILTYENSLLILVPLLNTEENIQETSNQLALILKNTMTSLKSTTVLWYNKQPSFLEIFYKHPTLTKPSFWILNDTPLNIKNTVLQNTITTVFNKHTFKEK